MSEIKNIIAIILFLICAVYGIIQAIQGNPALGLDYWLVCLGIFVSVVLLVS